jgi:hypothetical protein
VSLDLCKPFLADLCQQERHAKREQNIRDEKEDDFFQGQNPKEQNPCGLTR